MGNFRRFAVELLRYRAWLALAAGGLAVSSMCFGAGLMTLKPVFETMLKPDATSLRDLVAEGNARIGGMVPAEWIQQLPTDRFQGTVVVLLTILGLTVIGAAGKYVYALSSMSITTRHTALIRKQAFHRIIHLPMKTIVAEGTMDRINRVIRDTNQLKSGFNAVLGKAPMQALNGVAALAVAVVFGFKLAVIAVIGVPILALVLRVFTRRIRKASKRSLVQSAGLLATLTQAMQGIRVVKVHGAERKESGRFHRVNKRLMEEEMAVRKAKAISSPLIEALTLAGVVFLAIIASWFIFRQGISGTNIIMTLGALAAAGAQARPLTELANDVSEAAAAADRLAELLDERVEPHLRMALLSPHSESIVFENVRLKYPRAEHFALRGVNLKIAHGETIAFVGPNGSGKTTLLSLIPRLFDPDSGRVLIDGTPVDSVSMRSLRAQIGMVTQEVVLFNDTIAANISYGSPEATEAEIIEAARRARCEEFILSKPRGYDTIVGEQGVTLSGGQRQRLAIARAILRNPRILILDEATSMIDAESEAQIVAVLDEFCHERTSLVIAHRLSTVINSDRIVVMDQGSIVDVGRHAELLPRCGLYQQLCRTQLVQTDVA